MIFITGGVRSGKSSFAEKVARGHAKETGAHLHYVATGSPSDEEMEKRIERHQREREESELSWKTWEQPTGIETLAPSFYKKDIVLLDCVTTLLNNELYSVFGKKDPDFHEAIFKRILTGVEVIDKNCLELVLVSNEVLFEPMIENDLVEQYCYLLGNLHQMLVDRAKTVYLVEAGIPIVMKGEEQ